MKGKQLILSDRSSFPSLRSPRFQTLLLPPFPPPTPPRCSLSSYCFGRPSTARIHVYRRFRQLRRIKRESQDFDTFIEMFFTIFYPIVKATLDPEWTFSLPPPQFVSWLSLRALNYGTNEHMQEENLRGRGKRTSLTSKRGGVLVNKFLLVCLSDCKAKLAEGGEETHQQGVVAGMGGRPARK